MSLPASTDLRRSRTFYSKALTQMLYQLRDMAHEMASNGFEEEAETVKTAIGDLEWVYESVIDKELTAQVAPSNRRQPLRLATH